jgi:hypothetical protein
MELAADIDTLVFASNANPGHVCADTATCASNTTPISARQTLRKKLRVTPGLAKLRHGQPTSL